MRRSPPDAGITSMGSMNMLKVFDNPQAKSKEWSSL